MRERMEIFKDGRLFIWSEDDLDKAESIIDSDLVTSLRIGAKCYSCVGLEILYPRLSKYHNVMKIEVADDRIVDADMPSVKRRFEMIFPNAIFNWGYDLLVGGKYGR